MNAYRKSRTAWVLMASYVILAGPLFYQAFTCTRWVCDFLALPAAVPLGFPIAGMFEAIDYVFVMPDLTTGILRRWYFILPTVLANAIFYFWAGWQLEKLVTRLLRRSA